MRRRILLDGSLPRHESLGMRGRTLRDFAETDCQTYMARSVKQRLNKANVWRLLDEAKGLIAGGKASIDRMKQAEATLDSANELGLNDEQQAVYQRLLAKLSQRRSPASPNMLSLDRSTGGEGLAGSHGV